MLTVPLYHAGVCTQQLELWRGTAACRCRCSCRPAAQMHGVSEVDSSRNASTLGIHAFTVFCCAQHLVWSHTDIRAADVHLVWTPASYHIKKRRERSYACKRCRAPFTGSTRLRRTAACIAILQDHSFGTPDVPRATLDPTGGLMLCPASFACREEERTPTLGLGLFRVMPLLVSKFTTNDISGSLSLYLGYTPDRCSLHHGAQLRRRAVRRPAQTLSSTLERESRPLDVCRRSQQNPVAPPQLDMERRQPSPGLGRDHYRDRCRPKLPPEDPACCAVDLARRGGVVFREGQV